MIFWFKDVLMMPSLIGPPDLDIDKSAWRIPEIYPGLPAQGNTSQLDPILDQSPFPHLYRTFCKDLKLQPGRRDSLQIPSVAKEWKDLCDRFGKPNFRAKERPFHR